MTSPRKKVLVVSYFFPPVGGGGVARTVKFVKYLRDFGYEPIVLTPKNPAHSVFDESYLRDLPQGIEIIRTPYWGLHWKVSTGASAAAASPSKFRKKIRRGFRFVRSLLAHIARGFVALFFIPDPQALWRFFARREALRVVKERNIALVYTTSSPYTNHLIGRMIQRKTAVPWVADFRDHWTLSKLYEPITPLHRFWHGRIERRIMANAQAVILNQKQNEKDVVKKFGPLIKKHVAITNGYDPRDFPPRTYIHHGPITLRYFGSLYAYYSVEPLLRILQRMIEKSPRTFRIEFIGDVDRMNVERLQQSPYYNTNIFVRSYVPHAEVDLLMQDTTVLLLTLPHFEKAEDECMIPQKLFEYIGARRPIIACMHPKGMSADLVRSTQAGIVVSQEEKDIEKNVEAILSYIDTLEKNNWDTQYDPARLPHLHRKYLTEQLAKLFDEVLS